MYEQSRKIAVAAESPDMQDGADQLAKRLGLTRNDIDAPTSPFLLVLTAQRLELRQTEKKAPGPVYVDFSSGPLAYRLTHGGGRSQSIAKAVGLKGNHNPFVIDATAGLGRDAMVLASLGCRVMMLERSPIIAALLADGLKRAGNDPKIGPVIQERLQLIEGDGRILLENYKKDEKAEVVFLDPMYPERLKSSLVKKEMRILQKLIGQDPDAEKLFHAAIDCAGRRVVVKRPKSAPLLAVHPKPSMTIASKNSRFDVYLVNL